MGTAMGSKRTTAMVGLALAVGLAVSACSTPEAETTPTPSRSGSTAPAPSPTKTPTDISTTAAPVAWTTTELTAMCADFQAGWAEGEGFVADDFEWTSPASTQQNGGTWFVFLQGTFTTPDGDAVPAEYTCAISGTTDAPVVEQAASE
jgi:hypothetical protein